MNWNLRLWMTWSKKKLEHCVTDVFLQVSIDPKMDFLNNSLFYDHKNSIIIRVIQTLFELCNICIRIFECFKLFCISCYWIFKNRLLKHLLLLIIYVSVVGSCCFNFVLVRNELPGSIPKSDKFLYYKLNYLFISTSFLSLKRDGGESLQLKMSNFSLWSRFW